MFPTDPICDVLLNDRLDLMPEDEDLVDFIEHHLSDYKRDIRKATESKQRQLGNHFPRQVGDYLKRLDSFCDEIVAIHKMLSAGKIEKAYNSGYQLFDEMKAFLLIAALTAGDHRLYRIRPGNYSVPASEQSSEKLLESKRNLFHAPKQRRDRVGPSRFSQAGHPCLYLASGRELAWLESGMPGRFSYCQFKNNVTLEVVDFAVSPILFISGKTSLLKHQPEESDAHQQACKELLQYILSYPLMASCLIKCPNRNANYIQEYSFPQLFMSWIRDGGAFDGIRYKPALDPRHAECLPAANIALAVKNYNANGFDDQLVKKFELSKVFYLNVSEDW